MADQRIDYTSSNDDDIRASEESISPYNNGERAVESVLRRPSESLRSRTEVDRTALEESKYLLDSNVKWLVTGGNASGAGASLPQITTWDPDAVSGPDRGVFTISADTVFQPLTTVRADTLGNTFVWTFDDGTDSGTLTVSSKLLSSEGGDVLSFEIEYTATTGILTVETLDSVSGKIQRVKITVSGDASKSMTDLKTALESDSDITDRFTLVWGGNWNATEIDTGQTVPTAGIYSPTEKPWEREMHLLQPTDLASFFSASDDNKLQDGDTLAIYYPYLVDPDKFLEPLSGTNDGRRQACVSNTNVTLGSAQLVNLGTEPDKLPYCIPICKRISDDLYFVDGTVIKGELQVTDPAVYFGEHGYTLDRYASSTGASEIGAATQAAPGGEASVDTWDIPADNLQDVLGAAGTGLQDFINDKASLNAAETVTAKWSFDENVIIDASSGLGSDLTGLVVIGKGLGAGINASGGSGGLTGGDGVSGTGGSGTNGGGTGLKGTGASASSTVDAGDGTQALGGAAVDGTAGVGVKGTGGSISGTGTAGIGVHGIGGNKSAAVAGAGVKGEGGTGAVGTGVWGVGSGGGQGVYGDGGATGGTGVQGDAGTDGIGVDGNGDGDGVGGRFTGGTNAAAIRLVPRSSTPTSLATGIMWVNSTSKDVFARPGSTNVCLSHIKAWATIDVSSGTPSLLDSYNVAGVVASSSDVKDLKITFTDAFANTDYAAYCGMIASGIVGAEIAVESKAETKATGTFGISGWNMTSTPSIAQIDFSDSGTNAVIYVEFMGERAS